MKGAVVKSRILFAALLAAGLAFIPSAAHAKGATEASVKGPGLATAIRLDMTDGPGPSVHTLAESSGLYETMYAQTPNLTPPTADLGPRYEATYTVLADSVVRQHLYPFARGGAAAYVPPGQPLEGGQSTRGGWFRGPQTVGLKPLLISLGPLAQDHVAAMAVAVVGRQDVRERIALLLHALGVRAQQVIARHARG